MDLADIAALELAAYRAVPAQQVVLIDGWHLRITPGLPTKRANSVFAQRVAGGRSPEDRLARVEAFYGDRSLPARYQLCPASQPSGLDDVLLGRGYAEEGRTAVQVAAISGGRTSVDPAIAITSQPTGDWWAAWGSALTPDPARVPHLAALFRRIAGDTGFAVATLDGAPAAVGLGVRDGPHLGIYNMATLPARRRRGAARAVLEALLHWGRDRGATTAYLQVEQNNAPAVALYERMGFREQYVYRYLTR
jgi:N-acetylglutamate synthase